MNQVLCPLQYLQHPGNCPNPEVNRGNPEEDCSDSDEFYVLEGLVTHSQANGDKWLESTAVSLLQDNGCVSVEGLVALQRQLPCIASQWPCILSRQDCILKPLVICSILAVVSSMVLSCRPSVRRCGVVEVDRLVRV